MSQPLNPTEGHYYQSILFTRTDMIEFFAAIAAARAGADVLRHQRRIDSARRIGCISASQESQLRKALGVRVASLRREGASTPRMRAAA
jgi:hypothetical protein